LCDPDDDCCSGDGGGGDDGVSGSGSDGVVGSTPPRLQTLKVFPSRKIVILTLNYCLILENAIGNDFCFFLIVAMNWLSKAKVCNKNNLPFVHPHGINHYNHTHTYLSMWITEMLYMVKVANDSLLRSLINLDNYFYKFEPINLYKCMFHLHIRR
jgi:hypothetical protein